MIRGGEVGSTRSAKAGRSVCCSYVVVVLRAWRAEFFGVFCLVLFVLGGRWSFAALMMGVAEMPHGSAVTSWDPHGGRNGETVREFWGVVLGWFRFVSRPFCLLMDRPGLEQRRVRWDGGWGWDGGTVR